MTDISPEDLELIEKADVIHIKQYKGQTELSLFFWQKNNDGFVVASERVRRKINEMKITFDGQIEIITNPKFIKLIKTKGKWV